MPVPIDRLRQLAFFADLDDDALRHVASSVYERAFSPSRMIILEGEACQAVYFVVQGVVRARRMSLEGREHVLGYLGRGEMFNLVPMLDGSSNLSTVDAVTEAILYILPCERARQILEAYPALAMTTLRRLAAEVRHLTDMVEDLALHTVRTRLARFLLSRAEETGPSRRWTQEEIATHIGTVREMVGRSLRDFVAQGLIRRERGRIVVVDQAGLEDEAAGG
jgi:CRP/FNR family cyclic AMP-dependent transcriptional regulator